VHCTHDNRPYVGLNNMYGTIFLPSKQKSCTKKVHRLTLQKACRHSPKPDSGCPILVQSSRPCNILPTFSSVLIDLTKHPDLSFCLLGLRRLHPFIGSSLV
jgi:hypothetical protein